jgi:hypothetical protein
MTMNQLVWLYAYLVGLLIVGAGFLHLLSHLGAVGEKTSQWFCSAPGVDLALAYFMLLPLMVAWFLATWQGLAVALLAELSALWLWIMLHELAHRQKSQAKIHRQLSSTVGAWRNHLAVWITAFAVPLFWVVRFVELIVYPPLTKLVGLPRYDAKEWVNVSRHKFEGLIGYDLIWCLYCDWMTGVWSLGTEMLRNVESFWCPIRFYSEKKCANCQQDFPDVNNGWIAADATMKDVTALLASKYTTVQKERAWYGHPCRNCHDESSN